MNQLIEFLTAVTIAGVVFGAIAIGIQWTEPNDGTDTGVGCVDDCLEPAKE